MPRTNGRFKRWMPVVGVVLFCHSTALPAQSLAEVAEKERRRRQNLQETSPLKEIDPLPVRQEASSQKDPVPSDAETARETPGPAESQPPPEETGASEAAEPAPSGSGGPTSLPTEHSTLIATPTGRAASTPESQQPPGGRDLHVTGTLYVDWMRAAYLNGEASGQLGNRLKMQMGAPPGDGWRVLVDLRHRFDTPGGGDQQLVVYDAALILEDRASPFSVSLGQMNLYDTAGVGELLGGLVGYRLNPSFTVGGYAGLERQIYRLTLDAGYQKFGAYARYHGTDARAASVSLNTLRFGGETERRFLYASGLLPLDWMTLYGNVEYELASTVATADRLSRLFLNTRFNLGERADVTASYSSGKGLDFHRFLLEQSKDPSLSDAELERYYYSTQYGTRLSVKIHPRLRVFVAQTRSEQKDRLIRNNTTRLGGSALDPMGLGLSLYGSYNMNRGDQSESDSVQFSVSRDFGPLSWTFYYSSAFNAVRYDARSGLPVIVHIDDRRTISNDFFFVLSRALALSVEYEYSVEGGAHENTLFTRAIYRF